MSEYYLADGNPPGRWVGTRPPHAAVSDPELGPLGSGRAGAPWLFPGARPGAHQRAGYLGTSLNEQLGPQTRPGRGPALCDLADELAAAVLAAMLGISVDTAGRWGALVKRDWTGYIAERDGQPSGPQQT